VPPAPNCLNALDVPGTIARIKTAKVYPLKPDAGRTEPTWLDARATSREKAIKQLGPVR
jgi:hypothetical protein